MEDNRNLFVCKATYSTLKVKLLFGFSLAQKVNYCVTQLFQSSL